VIERKFLRAKGDEAIEILEAMHDLEGQRQTSRVFLPFHPSNPVTRKPGWIVLSCGEMSRSSLGLDWVDCLPKTVACGCLVGWMDEDAMHE
jgi:hypothetical protein